MSDEWEVAEDEEGPLYCERCEEKKATCTMTLLFTNSLDAMQFLCGQCLVYNVDDWQKFGEKGEPYPGRDNGSFIIERMDE